MVLAVQCSALRLGCESRSYLPEKSDPDPDPTVKKKPDPDPNPTFKKKTYPDPTLKKP